MTTNHERNARMLGLAVEVLQGLPPCVFRDSVSVTLAPGRVELHAAPGHEAGLTAVLGGAAYVVADVEVTLVA